MDQSYSSRHTHNFSLLLETIPHFFTIFFYFSLFSDIFYIKKLLKNIFLARKNKTRHFPCKINYKLRFPISTSSKFNLQLKKTPLFLLKNNDVPWCHYQNCSLDYYRGGKLAAGYSKQFGHPWPNTEVVARCHWKPMASSSIDKQLQWWASKILAVVAPFLFGGHE